MPLGRRIVRNVDLVLLALAIPVWVALELPVLGWMATTVAWLATRWLQAIAERKALAKGNRQAALGARAASLLARLYLVTIAVFVAGLIDRDAGLSAGVLAASVFTVYFISLFLRSAFEEDAA